MNIKKISICLLFLFSQALHATEPDYLKQRFTLKTSLGYLSGTAHEFVYDTDSGATLSQLNWQMEDDPIIRAEGTYQINSWLEAAVSGWINIKDGAAQLDDYDWAPPIQAWANWSHHPDTDLRQANEADINLKAWLIQQPQYRLAGVVGYQRNLYSFAARGGCYTYNFGELIGCFPDDQLEIGYKQTFNMPYIGVAGAYLLNSVELQGQFKYSNQVTARDIDQHYQRTLTFYEGSDHFNFYNAILNVGYYVKPQVKLFAEGMYNYIPNKKTGTVIVDYTTNERFDFEGDAAGLSNKNYSVAIGIQYTGLDS